MFAEISQQVWSTLRRQLEAAALIEVETLQGVTAPFLRFHPTLAPMLWPQLSAHEQERQTIAYRHQYYVLAVYLRQTNIKHPLHARTIALRELPNLLHAVYAALDAGDPEAGEFADFVNGFLKNLGFLKESETLVAKTLTTAGKTDLKAWVLAQSNRGVQLHEAGRVADAIAVFRAVLEKLGDAPSYERAVALGRIGQCFADTGRPDLAALHARDSIAIFKQLEQTDQVKRHYVLSLTDLADALTDQGEYAEARKIYKEVFGLAKELNDPRQQIVVLGQLGTLAIREGKLSEAEYRARAALTYSRQLREPMMEATAWHQLGVVFQQREQWDEAERHYRESARIKEEQGNLAEAAKTWSNLAVVSAEAGKLEAAEMWLRKTIEVDRKLGNPIELAPDLSNLASILKDLPGRLVEARQLAEEALDVYETLGPGAFEVWRVYIVLAEITEMEAEATSDRRLKVRCQTQAREYHRLARDAEYNFAGTRHKLQQFAPQILAVVDACAGKPKARQALADFQQQLVQAGVEGQALSAAFDHVFAGERDENVLCEGLTQNAGMILKAILHALSEPSTLKHLFPDKDY